MDEFKEIGTFVYADRIKNKTSNKTKKLFPLLHADPDPETPGTEDPTPTDPGSDGKNGDDSTDPKDGGSGDVVIEDGDGSTGGTDSVEGDKAGALPATATNMFTLILVGSILTIVGGATFIFRRRVA